jgi:hypothetical protein
MSGPVSNLNELLRSMHPVLNDGAVAFCVLPHDADLASIAWIGLFREAEGLTVIVPDAIAVDRGWRVMFRAAWITLTVHSDLHAVGLTAAVSDALADNGISCNVVAAAHHDHLFVPVDEGAAALAALRDLQATRAAAS